MSAQCRSCNAPVTWIVNEKTGKRMALDPLPLLTHGTRFRAVSESRDEQGRLVIIAVSCSGDELGMRAHFASCPDRDEWRR